MLNTYTLASAAIILLITYLIRKHNSIIKNKNSIKRAWTGIITQERQKNQILPAVEEVATKYQVYEERILKAAGDLRLKLKLLSQDTIDIEALSSVEASTASVFGQINVVLATYPELASTTLMQNLVREIREQQENVAIAIQTFNKNIEQFNNNIQTFPASLINSLFHKENKLTLFYNDDVLKNFEHKANC
jgi:LemA protein